LGDNGPDAVVEQDNHAGVVDAHPPGAPPGPPLTAATVIGQATAALAVAAAVIYAAGALSLGLRLWYDQYSWEPVLGQLPRDFLLVDAIIVISLAIVLGLAAYPLYRKIQGSGGRQLSNRTSWLWSVAAAAVLAAVPVAFLPFVRSNTIHGVIRPYWQIYVACFVFNLIFLRIALYVLPKIKVEELKEVLSIGVLAFSLIPAVASVVATYRFPIVELCGSEFDHQGQYGNYASGNLIGTNGQWVYVAEALVSSPKQGQYIFHGAYIAVIPLSAVQLESIGPDATCSDLHASVTHGS
jgi:hypothetical protein